MDSIVRTQIENARVQVSRKHMRARKRYAVHAYFAIVGLNGPRAVARRARQIALGQLQVSA